MPTRFVEPDTKVLLDSIRQLMTQLAAYGGEPIGKTHALVGCAWWVGYASMASTNVYQTSRMVRPLNRLWRVMQYAANDRMPCYRPSEWPDLVETDSFTPNPKLARDWRDILERYLRAFAELVVKGEYGRLVTKLDPRRAEAWIERRLDEAAGYGLRVQE